MSRLLEHRGNSLFVTVSGVLGINEGLTLLRHARIAQLSSGAAVVICDLRAALLTLNSGEYLSLVNEEIERPIPVPVGFVAGFWLATMGGAHCVLMARRGHERAFFDTPLEAALWSGEHIERACALARVRREPQAALLQAKPRRPRWAGRNQAAG